METGPDKNLPPGTYYYVVCGNCGKNVVYKPALPVTGYTFKKRSVEVTCGHCGTRRSYTVDEVSVGVVAPEA